MKNICNLTQEQAVTRFKSIYSHGIKYNLHLNINKGKSYDGVLEMEFKAINDNSVFLEYLGKGFRYNHVNYNEVPLIENSHEYLRKNGFMQIPTNLLKYGLDETNFLKITFENDYANDGWGMHSNNDVDGSQYVYTQSVPHYFNRVAPVFDQPDLKGSIKLSVMAPPDWTIISKLLP